MVKRVILIRPGETDWNRSGRWQGWVASPLNALGRQQAAKLANFVRHIGMAALYSSDLRRARETAEIIAQQLGYEPIYDARLRERNIGIWQGLTLDEMRDWYPDDYRKLLEDPDNFEVPGGESRADVLRRVSQAFDSFLEEARGDTIGILSHTTAIKALLTHLFSNVDERRVSIDNTSVTTLHRADGVIWQLVAVDDVLHLEGMETKAIGELEY